MQGLYTSSNTNNGANTGFLYFNANNGASNANANISSQLQSVDFLILTSA